MPVNTYKDKQGNTRYWATQSGAWNMAAKLNENLQSGQWLFEHEYGLGWFIYLAE